MSYGKRRGGLVQALLPWVALFAGVASAVAIYLAVTISGVDLR